METVRTCTKCKITKPIEEFHFSHKARGYRRHECNGCETERKNGWFNANHARETHKHNKYYRDNREKICTPEWNKRNAAYQKRYRDKLKEIVYDYYGRRCACCGETEPMFLSIDHVNNDGYALRKYKGHPQQGHVRFLRWLIDNNFPSDYQILCMNCNFGKAKNGGVCPHQTGSTTISQESTPKLVEARHTQTGDDIVSSTVKAVAA
jgi:hypothetical protein